MGDCIGVVCHNGTYALRKDIIYFNLNPYNHSSDFRWKNFWPRGIVSKEQFNESIKKRNVHYWRLDL